MTRSADAWPRSRASASSSSSRPWYRCQRATHASLTLQTKLPSTCTATWPRRVALSAVTTGTTGALKDLAGDWVDALGRDRLGGRRRDGRCGADRHQREPRLLADLQLDGADGEADGGVELERLAAGGDFGAAEHDADLLAQLIGEAADRARPAEGAGELAQRLAHEAGLQADEAVAHLALYLGLGRERRYRVDGDDVEGAAAHQHLGDLERLLAVVGLRHQQLVDVDADGLCVHGVHGVLGVDEGGLATEPLRLRDEVIDHGGLARRLRAVDLADAAARDAADAEGDVEGQRPGGHELHVIAHGMVAEAHDAALAELALDLRDGCLKGFVLVQGSAPLLLRTREILPGECARRRPSPEGYYTRRRGRHKTAGC